jgi:hypothetical protein
METQSRDLRSWTTISGVAAAGLFALGNAIWGLGMPEDGTAVPEVIDFYEDRADRIVVGGSISMISIGAFVAFAAVVRRLLADAEEDDLLANTAFGGAILGMSAGLAAESINLLAALRAQDGELNDGLGQALFESSQMFGSAATGVGLGVFALATAAGALRTGRIVPRGSAIVIAVLGGVMLSPLAHVNVLAGAGMIAITTLIVIGVRRG